MNEDAEDVANEDELRAKMETELAEASGDVPVEYLLKREINILRLGYTTSDTAIFFGYLFILIPKLIFAVGLYWWANQNRENGMSIFLIAVGGYLIINLWNLVLSRLWFRWASNAIYPEEADAFYSLEPKWLMGEKMWDKLTSELRDKFSSEDE